MKEPLAKGAFTSCRDREPDYEMQSILHAPSTTPEKYGELNTMIRAGKITNEENAKWSTHS